MVLNGSPNLTRKALSPATLADLPVPDVLSDRVTTIFNSLKGQPLFDLKNHLLDLHDNSIVLKVGTACSGSDILITALSIIFETFAAHVPGVTFIHEFSVEINPAVREFIQASHCPTYMFEDVCHLNRDIIYDLRSQRNVLTPSVSGVGACFDFVGFGLRAGNRDSPYSFPADGCRLRGLGLPPCIF